MEQSGKRGKYERSEDISMLKCVTHHCHTERNGTGKLIN